MAEQAHDRLRALVRRAEGEPFFLASALKAYAESEGMNDENLARFLGCAPEALDPIRLCRRPAGEAPRFRDDVLRIAQHFGLHADRLAGILRRVDALAALRPGGAPPGGELRAARDREPDAEESEEER